MGGLSGSLIALSAGTTDLSGSTISWNWLDGAIDAFESMLSVFTIAPFNYFVGLGILAAVAGLFFRHRSAR